MRTEIRYRDVLTRSARVRVGEMGTGRPLVLIHDLFGSHEDFTAILQPLAERMHVILIDLPGFGESEKPRKYAYGFEGFAETVLDALAALSLSRVTLLGHGFGGGIALTLASRHPSVAERLILVDPAVYELRPTVLFRLARTPGIGRLLLKQLVGVRSFGRLMPHSDARAPRVKAEYDRFNSPDGREAAVLALDACMDLRPVQAVVPRISTPTLVVWGDSDPMLSPHEGRRLARELSRGTLVVLGAGHWPHQELPALFVEHVVEFLRDESLGDAG